MIYLFTDSSHYKADYHIYYDDDSITGVIYVISDSVKSFSFRYHNYMCIGNGSSSYKLTKQEYTDFVHKYDCGHKNGDRRKVEEFHVIRSLIEERIFEISIKKL